MGNNLPWAATAIVCLLLASCSRQAELPSVPTIELDGATPELVKKLDQARQSVQDNPTSADAWGRMGMVFNAHDFMDQAIFCYQRAAELAPQEFRWSYLAAVLLAELDPSQAEEALRQAAEISSQYTPLYCNLARALVRLGRDDEARREYETALGIDPRCRDALIGLGELELQNGELDLSRKHLLAAADLQFKDHDVHALLGRVYHRMGNQESAEIELNLVRAFPKAAPPSDTIRATAFVQESTGINSLQRLGNVYFDSGKFADAESVFRQLVDQRAGSAVNHMQLGKALAEQNKLAEAIQQLETAMAIDDQVAEIVYTYGLILARHGEVDRASKLMNRAIELDPNSDASHFYAGMTLESQGQLEQARQAFLKTVQLNPANAMGQLYLGNVLAKLGELDQAIVHWRLTLTYQPGQQQAVFALARAYNGKKLHSETDELLRREFKRSPADPVILTALANHLVQCPDTQFRSGPEAIRLAEQLVSIRGIDRVRSLVFLASVLAATGDYQRAIATLQNAQQANASGRNDPAITQMILRKQQQFQNRHTGDGPPTGFGDEAEENR